MMIVPNMWGSRTPEATEPFFHTTHMYPDILDSYYVENNIAL